MHFVDPLYCTPVLLFESFVVVTAFGYAYDRLDGVAVVPVTTLGPERAWGRRGGERRYDCGGGG
ncbi:MAG: hypothetical protein OXH86_02020 [Acidimicrobiaceae bacterium]|nr:hypothetical protein [Acidimicrobiaceae bacterium]